MVSRNKLPLALICLAFSAGSLSAEIVGIEAGYNFNYWNPNNIDQVDYNTTGLNGGFMQLDLPFYSLLVNRPLLRYEWTPGDKSQQEQIQLKLADSTSLEKVYERILVYIPYKNYIVKYEKEVFIADLRLQEDKIYYSFDNNPEHFGVGETITELVTFQELSCHYVTDGFIPFYLGVSYGMFQKPFALDGDRESYIYDAKFEYLSLDFGSASRKPEHSGFAFVYDICLSGGSGDIKLSKGNRVSEMLEERDMSVTSAAIRGMVGMQYNRKWFAAALSLKARGRMYDLEKKITHANGAETDERVGSINKDSIFKAEASITIKF